MVTPYSLYRRMSVLQDTHTRESHEMEYQMGNLLPKAGGAGDSSLLYLQLCSVFSQFQNFLNLLKIISISPE